MINLFFTNTRIFESPLVTGPRFYEALGSFLVSWGFREPVGGVSQLTLYRRYGLMPSGSHAGAAVIMPANVDQVMALVERGYR